MSIYISSNSSNSNCITVSRLLPRDWQTMPGYYRCPSIVISILYWSPYSDLNWIYSTYEFYFIRHHLLLFTILLILLHFYQRVLRLFSRQNLLNFIFFSLAISGYIHTKIIYKICHKFKWSTFFPIWIVSTIIYFVKMSGHELYLEFS